MKTQRLTLNENPADLKTIPAPNTTYSRLAFCAEVIRELFGPILTGLGTATVSFNRRPFKGAKKIFVNINHKTTFWGENVHYGMTRETATNGYVYTFAQETLLPFFPKNGTFPLYILVTKTTNN